MNNKNSSEDLTIKEQRELQRQEKQARAEERARSQGARRWLVWFGVALVIVGGVWGMTKLAKQQPTVVTGEPIPAVSASDRTNGATNAKVTLIEYSDFQCPACGAYYPILKKLNEELGGKVMFVYRYFPLRGIHQNAQISAQAGEAAGLQGKFWQMHDILFDNQAVWSDLPNARDTFVKYATNLGLDIERFKRDMDSDAVKNKIENDYQAGIKSGINSTPSFFLNGEKITGPQSYEEFKKLIEQALATNA